VGRKPAYTRSEPKRIPDKGFKIEQDNVWSMDEASVCGLEARREGLRV
jgi:hypothetical protein